MGEQELDEHGNNIFIGLKDLILNWIVDNTRTSDHIAVLLGLGCATGIMASLIDEMAGAERYAAILAIADIAKQAYDIERLEAEEPAGHA